jgi:hypothetical protein
MQMKKLILLIYAGLCSFTVACGQAVKLGVLVGPNLSTIGSQNTVSFGETAGLELGGHAGLFTEITAGSWSIEPGLVYADIGGKVNLGFEVAGNETVSLQYLQVPVNLVYNTAGRKFFFGGGPYIGFGLSGSINGSITAAEFIPASAPSPFNLKYTFNSGNSPDYGINLLAGVHLEGGTIFTIGCGLGLRQATSGNTFIAVRNDVISISIGHRIF